MKPSYLKKSSCEFKKKWIDELIWLLAKERKEFIRVNTHFQVLSIVLNVVIYTEELHGIIEEKNIKFWRCCTRATHGPEACEARTIKEEDLQEAVIEAINHLISESSELKEIIKENIEKVITGNDSGRIEEIDKEMLKVQEEILKVANAKKDYTDLANQVEKLRNEKEKILLSIAEEKNEQSRLKELEEFLENHELEIERYDEDLVRKLVDKVVVYDEELKIVFKSGVEVVVVK